MFVAFQRMGTQRGTEVGCVCPGAPVTYFSFRRAYFLVPLLEQKSLQLKLGSSLFKSWGASFVRDALARVGDSQAGAKRGSSSGPGGVQGAGRSPQGWRAAPAHRCLSAGRVQAPPHSEKVLMPRQLWLWVVPQIQVHGLPLNHRRPEAERFESPFSLNLHSDRLESHIPTNVASHTRLKKRRK